VPPSSASLAKLPYAVEEIVTGVRCLHLIWACDIEATPIISRLRSALIARAEPLGSAGCRIRAAIRAMGSAQIFFAFAASITSFIASRLVFHNSSSSSSFAGRPIFSAAKRSVNMAMRSSSRISAIVHSSGMIVLEYPLWLSSTRTQPTQVS
jgi:hypothetical protein